jgi:hypothetical protein
MTVTADVKAGYSETLDAVMKIGARDYSGWCGANLEDGTPHGGTPIRKYLTPATAFEQLSGGRGGLLRSD